eukprot:12272677-Alexandrium_andersonii.AAC.1
MPVEPPPQRAHAPKALSVTEGHGRHGLPLSHLKQTHVGLGVTGRRRDSAQPCSSGPGRRRSSARTGSP